MKKLLFVLLLGILLIGIPVTLLLVQNQQDTRQRAFVSPGGRDTCDLIEVSLQEDPVCPRIEGTTATNTVSKYKVTFTLNNLSGSEAVANYTAYSYFCSNPELGICTDNEVIDTQNISIPANQSKTIIVERANPNQLACGTYQIDFKINSINNRSECNYTAGGTNNIRDFGVCQTGIEQCILTTPTLNAQAVCEGTEPKVILSWTPIPNFIGYYAIRRQWYDNSGNAQEYGVRANLIASRDHFNDTTETYTVDTHDYPDTSPGVADPRKTQTIIANTSGVKNATDYSYWLAPNNDTSKQSNQVNVTTLNCGPSPTPSPTPPACPVPTAVKNVKINCPNCNL